MSLWRRVRNVFRGDAVNGEIAEELESHVDEAVASGRDAREARRAMGSVMRVREESHQMRVVGWMDSLRADVVFGWRQLWKRKVTTAAAVVSLGLAMGSCLAAFRLVDAMFLRPMPIAHPERLYGVYRSGNGFGDGRPRVETAFEYPIFEQMRDAVRDDAAVVAVAYMKQMDITYQSAAEMEKAQVQYVSGSMFGTFGLHPAAGRLLTESDDRTPGTHPVAVLSYDYWTRRFERDPGVVGRVLRTGTAADKTGNAIYEIVGVGPKGFTGTEPGTVTDVFLPTMMSPSVLQPTNAWLRILVSLKPGVAVAPVYERMSAAFEVNQRERAKGFSGRPKQFLERFFSWHIRLEPAANGISEMQKEYRLPMQALCVVVALVLFIACVNIANLMSAQAAARAREMALRVSLGAGRKRLAQLVMVESAMTGLASAGLGVVFAAWSAPLVVRMIGAPGHPVQLALNPDWRMTAFALGLGLAVTLLFGMAPALRASAVQPVNALKGGEEPQRPLRWMQGMIAAQTVFCLLVLFLAGLFVATFQRLTGQAMGFQPENVITLTARAQGQPRAASWDEVAEKLRSLPGVKEVGVSTSALLAGETLNSYIAVNGVASPGLAQILPVSPGWMHTMGISLVAGRDLRETLGDPGEAVVSKAFAKAYFGDGNPLGKMFQPTGANPHQMQVVGVANDALYQSMRDGTLPVFYIPYHWANMEGGLAPLNEGTFVVRVAGDDSGRMGETLRRTIVQTQQEFRVSSVRTEMELVEGQTVRERMLAALGGFFAGVALLLAAVGLYGVLHYSVVQRERELGIRIALGAAAGNIARIVSARVMGMVMLGAGVGLAAGLLSVKYVQALLYGVKGTDVQMMALPGAVLVGAAALAALPAVLRAMRIDPAVMLRNE